jgi:UPF0716 protein FxsA
MPIIYGLLLAPFLEIAGFVWLGPYLGVAGTLAFVIASAMLGLSLLRTQGVVTLMRLKQDLETGAAPVPAALDAAARIVAALLLIVPGFFSSTLGLLLLVPPVRALVTRFLGRRVEAGTVWAVRTNPRIIEGDYREVAVEPVELPPRR